MALDHQTLMALNVSTRTAGGAVVIPGFSPVQKWLLTVPTSVLKGLLEPGERSDPRPLQARAAELAWRDAARHEALADASERVGGALQSGLDEFIVQRDVSHRQYDHVLKAARSVATRGPGIAKGLARAAGRALHNTISVLPTPVIRRIQAGAQAEAKQRVGAVEPNAADVKAAAADFADIAQISGEVSAVARQAAADLPTMSEADLCEAIAMAVAHRPNIALRGVLPGTGPGNDKGLLEFLPGASLSAPGAAEDALATMDTIAMAYIETLALPPPGRGE